jgi:hypothetical protein
MKVYGAVAVALTLCVPARGAAADWVLTPIVGTTLRGTTGFVDLDATAGDRHPVYGVSAMRFPERLVGIGAEATMTPSFFTGHQLVESSRVVTANVSAIVAIPRSVLSIARPYVLVGVGLVRSSSDDLRHIFPIDSTLPALNAGAGVLVPISRHLGVRADVLFTRTTRGDDALGGGAGFLEMWRIAAGVCWTP